MLGNGVDLNFWRPGEQVGNFAVWSGRLVPEKAPHLAIEAAELAGMRLTLAGPAYDRAYFDDHVRPHLGPRVDWVGHLSRSNLAALVRQAAVAVVTPNWEEPFGLVAVEALASGTPVAAVARGALPDLVDEEVGALSSADPAGLAAAMHRARTRDRATCRARAARRFDVTDMVERYEHLLLGAASARRFVEGGAA